MVKELAKSVLDYSPKSVRSFSKKVYWKTIDIYDTLSGRDSNLPPRSMIFIGDGDYEQIGREFLGIFSSLAKIHPDHKILDVGCGIGRMAMPLAGFLSEKGEYKGFDIVREGIDWCNKFIAPKYHNFEFTHADIKNIYYNSNGKFKASNYKFPYSTNYFDFIFLTSVFTHMFRPDIENYLSEIARVLKPGGKVLITFFLLNDESKKLIKEKKSSQNFIHPLEGCMTANIKDPEMSIGYEETDIKKLFKQNNLEIIEPIKYGNWCGRSSYTSYQDIVLAIKK